MKTIFTFTALIFVFASLSLASVEASSPTIVMGEVWNEDFSATVPGASVSVECDDIIRENITNDEGDYQVEFSSGECYIGDSVTVTATKGELSGTKTEIVEDFEGLLHFNLAIVNVPIAPEFGVIVGTLTLVGAVGLFFFVRKH